MQSSFVCLVPVRFPFAFAEEERTQQKAGGQGNAGPIAGAKWQGGNRPHETLANTNSMDWLSPIGPSIPSVDSAGPERKPCQAKSHSQKEVMADQFHQWRQRHSISSRLFGAALFF